MQVRAKFLVLAVILVASADAKPIWLDSYIGNYDYPSAAISAQPEVLQYQDAYSPYYVYNVLSMVVHTDIKTVPTAVVDNGKPAISHLPAYNFYYGTPVYDFRFPLNPVYTVLRPSRPGLLPKPTPPPTTTMRPFDDDDGIEKLDSKVDPEKEMQKPSDNADSENDDSVVIEAI